MEKRIVPARKPSFAAFAVVFAILALAGCAGPALPDAPLPTATGPRATKKPPQTRPPASKRPRSTPVPPTPTPIPATPTPQPSSEPPNVSLVAPADNASVRGLVQVAAGSGKGITHIEFYVDDRLKFDDQTEPYGFNWDAFHEEFGTHASGGHVLRAVAYTETGAHAKSEIKVRVVPAAAGDCNSDGQVDQADLVSVEAEVNDNDGTNTEDTPGGGFAGNPACDANEDNLVDSADTDCVLQIISKGRNACLDPDEPLVVPLIFVPKDLVTSLDQDVIDFVANKIEEARRFYARANNGRTFRALPLEVVYAPRNHAKYWVDGSNYEYGVLQELQSMGYPVDVDWAKMPSNRLTWVLAFGSGGWAGGRHYPTGSGFSMWGDGLVFAAIDLDCKRVVDGTAGQGIEKICRESWLPSGDIYAFGIGGAIHELGHGFGLSHPPDGSPDWPETVMGYHWNYPRWNAPANGLSAADRAILAGSHYFPGFRDGSFPVAIISSPTAGSSVQGTVAILVRGSDKDGVSGMELLIDGISMTLPPLQSSVDDLFASYEWNTGNFPPGPHRIELRVTDTGGNVQATFIDVNT